MFEKLDCFFLKWMKDGWMIYQWMGEMMDGPMDAQTDCLVLG